jgi:hypothetical protein
MMTTAITAIAATTTTTEEVTAGKDATFSHDELRTKGPHPPRCYRVPATSTST